MASCLAMTVRENISYKQKQVTLIDNLICDISKICG